MWAPVVYKRFVQCRRIVGRFSSNGEISYTYATGTVDAENASYAGGICGYSSGRITNSLALNTKINGSNAGRIAGNGYDFAFNYASPWVQLSGKTFPDNQVANQNGANTSLDSFETDLKKETPATAGLVTGHSTPASYQS